MPEPVMRYDLEHDEAEHAITSGMVAAADGEYVLYDDYAALLSRARALYDVYTTDRGALVAVRALIASTPIRVEWLGGQRTAYVQRDAVLGWIDNALAAHPSEAPP